METIVAILAFLSVLGLLFWGVSCEVKHMKAAIAKEQKQMQLYEALLKKLEDL